MAIPIEHLGRALRLCGLTPSEKLIQTIEMTRRRNWSQTESSSRKRNWKS